MHSSLKLLIAAAIGSTALGATSTTTFAAGPRCGAVIVTSTTLRSDLKNCPGDGLVIGADNLTLDLGGHTIDGTGTAGTLGIRLVGHHGVTVARGTLKEFGVGVGVGGSDHNRLDQLVVTTSLADGIDVFESNDNVVSHANSSGNPFSGIMVVEGDRNRIVDGTFAGNHFAGIQLGHGSNGNRIADNLLTGSGDAAVGLDRANDNVVAGNRADGNVNGIAGNGSRNQIVDNLITDTIGCDDGCGAAIDGSGGSDVLIEGNRVIGTRREGILLHEFEADGGTAVTGNIVRRNLVRDAGTDGIALQNYTDEVSGQGTLTGNRVEENTVLGSGHDGINIGRPANSVARNLTLHNHVLGIEAVPGVIDGGGNLAFGNGDPRQCLRIACH